MWKRTFSFLKLCFLLVIVIIVFSYAMFQGGFVSWFLFYSVIIIVFLSFSTFFVPFRKIKVSRKFNRQNVFAGDDIDITIEISCLYLHPFCYVKIVDCLAKELKPHVERGTGALFFFTFKRNFHFTYSIKNLPRGEHSFTKIELEIGDLFGFFERKKSFTLEESMIVFPKLRSLEDYQIDFLGTREKKFPFLQAIETDLSIVGVRPYIPGDKLTTIDWKHSARQNELMTKQFSPTEDDAFLLVFQQFVELKKPELFEKLVELCAAFVHYFYNQKRTIRFVTLGSKLQQVKLDSFQAMYHHLARIQAVHKTFVPPSQFASNEKSWLVLSTILSNEFVKWLLEFQHVHIIVCWVTEKPTKTEKKNRLLLRENKIRVFTFTDEFDKGRWYDDK